MAHSVAAFTSGQLPHRLLKHCLLRVVPRLLRTELTLSNAYTASGTRYRDTERARVPVARAGDLDDEHGPVARRPQKHVHDAHAVRASGVAVFVCVRLVHEKLGLGGGGGVQLAHWKARMTSERCLGKCISLHAWRA